MSNSTKRAILRWIHLLFTIPILGSIYYPGAEQYIDGPRYIFVPVVMLSGYWMYAGLIFAVIGVSLWLGVYWLAGFGPALLTQIVLFIARKTWLVIRARQSQQPA